MTKLFHVFVYNMQSFKFFYSDKVHEKHFTAIRNEYSEYIDNI